MITVGCRCTSGLWKMSVGDGVLVCQVHTRGLCPLAHPISLQLKENGGQAHPLGIDSLVRSHHVLKTNGSMVSS